MQTAIEQLMQQLNTEPAKVEFQQVIDTINQAYTFLPTQFSNGIKDPLINEEGTNEGSCRIFAFGSIHQLSEEQTLHCFGDFYRKEVLEAPEGDNHGNIRRFMQDGWAGIQFDRIALAPKAS